MRLRDSHHNSGMPVALFNNVMQFVWFMEIGENGLPTIDSLEDATCFVSVNLEKVRACSEW